MEEEASCPALMASNSEGSRKSRLTGNSGSSTSIKCRICQLTESETGEPVKTSDCRCKRDLASVHRSCLTDWVNYKGNNTCEVCKAPFANVPAPILTENIDGEQTVLHELFMEYSQLNPMTGQKRIKLCGILTCLMIVSVSAAISITNLARPSSGSNSLFKLKFSLLLYSLCILGILMLFTLAAWVAMELKYSYRRRNLQRHAIRIIIESNMFDRSNSGSDNADNAV
ncbi:E3 ubiquitin-protein ligase MARCHF2-like isoform X3 [Gigantopelta aegis]|uniref:E3 ubiquitin-protein ligase MARCHF2-like isoform X3 n=1 Tax=Gigantopelta aegis TaxID=1735272 RepID=UPI001B889E23|nr:E3 ubiquitin-protein ligase MARCHF2-like isoform X3 [Gigantopelta aegis]